MLGDGTCSLPNRQAKRPLGIVLEVGQLISTDYGASKFQAE